MRRWGPGEDVDLSSYPAPRPQTVKTPGRDLALWALVVAILSTFILPVIGHAVAIVVTIRAQVIARRHEVSLGALPIVTHVICVVASLAFLFLLAAVWLVSPGY